MDLSAALRWHLVVLVGLQWDPWVDRQMLVVSPGSQHRLNLRETCSKSCMKHCWKRRVHHLRPLSGVASCRTGGWVSILRKTQLEEEMRKLTWRGAAMQKGLQANKEAHHTKCSLSAGHLFMHAEQTAWPYHSAPKFSVSLRSLYHSPMLHLKKLRENCWPNSCISHLSWNASQILHCGK